MGEQHPDTATSYNNVASCLDSQGKHAAALLLFNKALAISLKVLGEQHPHTANSYNNVAGCLNSQGKHAEACPCPEGPGPSPQGAGRTAPRHRPKLQQRGRLPG